MAFAQNLPFAGSEWDELLYRIDSVDGTGQDTYTSMPDWEAWEISTYSTNSVEALTATPFSGSQTNPATMNMCFAEATEAGGHQSSQDGSHPVQVKPEMHLVPLDPSLMNAPYHGVAHNICDHNSDQISQGLLEIDHKNSHGETPAVQPQDALSPRMSQTMDLISELRSQKIDRMYKFLQDLELWTMNYSARTDRLFEHCGLAGQEDDVCSSSCMSPESE